MFLLKDDKSGKYVVLFYPKMFPLRNISACWDKKRLTTPRLIPDTGTLLQIKKDTTQQIHLKTITCKLNILVRCYGIGMRTFNTNAS